MRRSTSEWFALVVGVLIGVIPVTGTAQTLARVAQWADSARRAIDAAYLAGEPDRIVEARGIVERALTHFSDDPWLQHYRGYALYREATLRQGRDPRRDVVDLLQEAEKSFAASIKQLALPESFALLSSVIGQQIGSNPLKGMTLGPKSDEAMEQAIARGPDNPRVWLLRGIGAMFTPGLFGGGVDRAEKYLRKAIPLFEEDQPPAPAPDWGADEAWVWLGRALEEQERWEDARQAYEKALQMEPRNTWVREDLLRNLDRRKAKM